jgi:hypothetical protein
LICAEKKIVCSLYIDNISKTKVVDLLYKYKGKKRKEKKRKETIDQRNF